MKTVASYNLFEKVYVLYSKDIEKNIAPANIIPLHSKIFMTWK
jgi:hypothetical protein